MSPLNGVIEAQTEASAETPLEADKKEADVVETTKRYANGQESGRGLDCRFTLEIGKRLILASNHVHRCRVMEKLTKSLAR